MSIKQIQLRGISRTPSDRMTSDGGCAESLNVHLDENEIAPTIAPKDVVGELNLPPGSIRPVVFIHKGFGYENYITFESGVEIGAYIEDARLDYRRYDDVVGLEEGEEFVSASSVGNTIIVMTTGHPHYALFKDGRYLYLGSKIPMPTVRITPEPVNPSSSSYPLYGREYRSRDGSSHTTPEYFLQLTENIDMDEWNAAAREKEESGSESGYEGVNLGMSHDSAEPTGVTFLSMMKEKVEQLYESARKRKCFVNQMSVMYAIRLYDGTLITSVPYLMPGGFESPFYFTYHRESRGSVVLFENQFTSNKEYFNYGARYPYTVSAQLLDFTDEDFAAWSDIIQSIEFFATPILPYEVSDEKYAYITRQFRPPVNNESVVSGGLGSGSTHTYYRRCDVEFRPSSQRYADSYLGRMLANTDFRLVAVANTGISSDGTDMFGELPSSAYILIDKLRRGITLPLDMYIVGDGDGDAYKTGQDILLTRPALTDMEYMMSNTEKIASSMTSINNRLLLGGVREVITPGSPVFPAAPCVLTTDFQYLHIEESHHVQSFPDFGIDDVRWSSDFAYDATPQYVAIVYHVRGGSDLCVMGRFPDATSEEVPSNLGYFGYLTYPDGRCTSVDIYYGHSADTSGYGWSKKTYAMKPHPYMPNLSYMYIGVDKNLLWDVAGITMRYEDGVATYSRTSATYDIDVDEQTVDRVDNKLYLSTASNPWVFTNEGMYTIQTGTNIMGFASATRALSQGQFGQFPMYVFTDEGIFAMSVNDEGAFSASHLVSRDVALKGTITPIDQAVVYATSRGLMLISGSDVQNISPYMNGKHYSLSYDADASGIIGADPAWSGLLPSMSDRSHFVSFMAGASIIYDYPGERLICYNPSSTYAYVYMIQSKSWHKMQMEYAGTKHVLNSYPDAYLSVADGESRVKIMNLSTVQDVSSDEVVKGVIVTRPFDLGEPDVRKAIKSIRVRGEYNRGDVKYILLGSLDGINWRVLTSLRGGSYKLFRLILLTSLSPTERISWIDIDYDSRFANKLR